MSDQVKDAITDIHHGYVKELAKFEFIAESLRVRAEEFCRECPDINGVAWALLDTAKTLRALNDRLDSIWHLV